MGWPHSFSLVLIISFIIAIIQHLIEVDITLPMLAEVNFMNWTYRTLLREQNNMKRTS